MVERPVRELITRGQPHQVYVDRTRALFGSWYEFFPRSTGGRDENGQPVHGTFTTSAKELDRVAAMGFDVVYLPPIHPIGTVHRKGPNSAALPGGNPRDPATSARRGPSGRPRAATTRSTPRWATSTTSTPSSPAPATSAWRSRSTSRCSARRTTRGSPRTPSGSPCAPTARSPTRRTRRRSTRTSTRSTSTTTPRASTPSRCACVLLWVEHGVRIFRVDNPHTKPPNFWHWLIWQVKAKYPDVLFLAEAFTRPARLFGLARLGYTQSYTTSPGGRARRSSPSSRSCTRSARTSAGRTCSSTPRTSCTSRCRPAARRCSPSAPRSPRRCPRPGASTPASSSSRGSRSRPGSEEYRTPRSTSCARATSPPR